MLTVYVNTDVKMSKKMLEALTMFEAISVFSNTKETTESEVKSFLESEYSKKLADSFISSYLFSTQDSLASPQ